MKRFSIAAVLAVSMAMGPQAAMADNSVVGGIVGGIIGSAIMNSQPKRVYRAPSSSSSSANSAARQANRETQTALNYFGFSAGTPDGVMGSRSRAAVSAYQAHMGYTPDGHISPYQRDFLISSYYRAQSGGPATTQLIASNPQGIKGLLIVYRDEQMNGGGNGATASIGGHYGLPSVVAAAVNEIAKSSDPSAEQLVQRSGFIQLSDINGDGQTDYIIDTSVTGSAFWCNAQSCAVRVFASTPDGYERNDFQAFNVTSAMFTCQRGTCSKTGGAGTQMVAVPSAPQPSMPQTQMVGAPVPSAQPMVQSPGGTMAAAAPTGIPNFFGDAPVQASLSSFCTKVSLEAAGGGYVTAASMSDAQTALGQQLCMARNASMAAGEELMAKVPNMTPAQFAQQCAGFGAMLKEQVAAVSIQSREQVMEAVSALVLSSGMAPSQLAVTAQICMSAGYRTDDLDAALGSALVLVALGQAPYAELVGHHLSQGFGAAKRPDLSVVWYAKALESLDSGAAPVFAAGQPERKELLRKASMMLSGNSAAAPAAPTGTLVQSLPVFAVSE